MDNHSPARRDATRAVNATGADHGVRRWNFGGEHAEGDETENQFFHG